AAREVCYVQDRRFLEAQPRTGEDAALLRRTGAAQAGSCGSLHWLSLLRDRPATAAQPHPGAQGSRFLTRSDRPTTRRCAVVHADARDPTNEADRAPAACMGGASAVGTRRGAAETDRTGGAYARI